MKDVNDEDIPDHFELLAGLALAAEYVTQPGVWDMFDAWGTKVLIERGRSIGGEDHEVMRSNMQNAAKWANRILIRWIATGNTDPDLSDILDVVASEEKPGGS
jgi:hypothetical protein